MAAALLLIWVGQVGCETPVPACPTGMSDEPRRNARLLALLSTTTDGRALLLNPPRRYRICVGPNQHESGVTPSALLLLPAGQSDSIAAARIAHLLTHLRVGKPFDSSSRAPCGPRLARARRLEQQAHALESRIRIQLGAPALPPDSVDKLMGQYAAVCVDNRKQ